uniref:CARD domain-containing protein n=1 Tax=Ditylenchus dipsaci TaxID=166011 RepID=A0A915E2D9_9BILA
MGNDDFDKFLKEIHNDDWKRSKVLVSLLKKGLSAGKLIKYLDDDEVTCKHFLEVVERENYALVDFISSNLTLSEASSSLLGPAVLTCWREQQHELRKSFRHFEKTADIFNSSSQSPKIMSSTSRYSVHSISMGLHTSIFSRKI